MAGPILGIDFLRKFKATVAPEISEIQFACATAASPASSRLPTAALSTSPCLPSVTPVPAPVPAQLPAQMTSSKPPSISAHVVRNPEVKSSSFTVREHPSLLDPTPALQNIPDSVPADVKLLLQKHFTIVRTGAVLPEPPHGVEHHIYTSSHPPFLKNPAALIHKNLKSPKQNSKG